MGGIAVFLKRRPGKVFIDWCKKNEVKMKFGAQQGLDPEIALNCNKYVVELWSYSIPIRLIKEARSSANVMGIPSPLERIVKEPVNMIGWMNTFPDISKFSVLPVVELKVPKVKNMANPPVPVVLMANWDWIVECLENLR
jgi:hypothetical protein